MLNRVIRLKLFVRVEIHMVDSLNSAPNSPEINKAAHYMVHVGHRKFPDPLFKWESIEYLFQITGLTVIEILRFAQNDVSKLVILKERQRLKNLDDLNRFPFTQKVEIVTSIEEEVDNRPDL